MQTYPTETVYFERDLLTAKVLSKLLPGSIVIADGFQSIGPQYEDYFDMVSSNIPFGNTAVYDRSFDKSIDEARQFALDAVHNYFFVKGIDTLREGGLLAYVTSQGVMDSPSNEPVRRWLMQHADLLSAVRLPDNLFKDFSGTVVGTDLIVLQKHSGKLSLTETEQAFILSEPLASGVLHNRLFHTSERIVHTSATVGKDLYGTPAMNYEHAGGLPAIAVELGRMLTDDLGQRLDKVRFEKFQQPIEAVTPISVRQVIDVPVEEVQEVRTAPVSVPKPAAPQSYAVPQRRRKARPAIDSLFRQGDLFSQPPEPEQTPEELEHIARENAFCTRDIAQKKKEALEPRPYTGQMLPHYANGSLVEQNGQYGFLRAVTERGAMFHPVQYTTMQRYRAEGYIPLRDIYQELYRTESTTQIEQPQLRAELNRLYDDFIRTIGELNGKENAAFILTDANGREILALERFVGNKKQKADILSAPVSINEVQITHVETAQEALTASLGLYGRVDKAYMTSIYDADWEQIADELKGRIYFNPEHNEYEIADTFLSGNVVAKAEELERSLNERSGDHRIEESLAAMREAFPTPITFEELDLNLGERWIPIPVYRQFIADLFQVEPESVTVKYAPKIDQFDVKVTESSAVITDKYCVKGDARKYDGVNLLTHALHNTVPDITKEIGRDENGRPIRVRDMENIQLADSKISEMRQAFSDWIAARPQDFRDELAALYNRTYNCFVRAQYDGSHQTFPGLNLKNAGIESLYESQRDAI